MKGSGFLNLADILKVNRDSAESMAQDLYGGTDGNGGIQQYGANVSKDIDRSERQAGMYGPNMWSPQTALNATDAQEQAKQLGSMGGRSQMLEKQNKGEGNYNAADQGFDAALTGQSAKLNEVSNAYSDLASKLGVAQQRSGLAWTETQHQQAVAKEQAAAAKAKADADRAAHPDKEAFFRQSHRGMSVDKWNHMVDNYWSQGLDGGDWAGYNFYIQNRPEVAYYTHEKSDGSDRY